MFKILLILGLVLSVVFVSGCLQQMADTGTGKLTDAQLEDNAAGMIEQEMEEAIENISMVDIEDSIAE